MSLTSVVHRCVRGLIWSTSSTLSVGAPTPGPAGDLPSLFQIAAANFVYLSLLTQPQHPAGLCAPLPLSLDLWQHLTAFLTLLPLVPSDSVPSSHLLSSLFISQIPLVVIFCSRPSVRSLIVSFAHWYSPIGLYTSIYSGD